MLKICKFNTIVCFLTKPYKILPFARQQNWPKKATKTALAACLMLAYFCKKIFASYQAACLQVDSKIT